MARYFQRGGAVVPYISTFDPAIAQYYGDILQDRSNRFDASFQGLAQAQAGLADIEAVDLETKQQKLGAFSDRSKGIVDKYGGDYGAAARELTTLIAGERKDPFWDWNKEQVKQTKIVEQLKANNPNLYIHNNPMDKRYREGASIEELQYSVTNPEDVMKIFDKYYAGLKSQTRDAGIVTKTAKDSGRQYDVQLTRIGQSKEEIAELKASGEMQETLKANFPQYGGDDPQFNMMMDQLASEYANQLYGGTKTGGMHAVPEKTATPTDDNFNVRVTTPGRRISLDNIITRDKEFKKIDIGSDIIAAQHKQKVLSKYLNIDDLNQPIGEIQQMGGQGTPIKGLKDLYISQQIAYNENGEIDYITTVNNLEEYSKDLKYMKQQRKHIETNIGYSSGKMRTKALNDYDQIIKQKQQAKDILNEMDLDINNYFDSQSGDFELPIHTYNYDVRQGPDYFKTVKTFDEGMQKTLDDLSPDIFTFETGDLEGMSSQKLDKLAKKGDEGSKDAGKLYKSMKQKGGIEMVGWTGNSKTGIKFVIEDKEGGQHIVSVNDKLVFNNLIKNFNSPEAEDIERYKTDVQKLVEGTNIANTDYIYYKNEDNSSYITKEQNGTEVPITFNDIYEEIPEEGDQEFANYMIKNGFQKNSPFTIKEGDEYKLIKLINYLR